MVGSGPKATGIRIQPRNPTRKGFNWYHFVSVLEFKGRGTYKILMATTFSFCCFGFLLLFSFCLGANVCSEHEHEKR